MKDKEGAPLSTASLHGSPRPATLKLINRRRFLEELRRRGPSTRAELTRATGVAPPTSSSIIADLLETGWLEQSDDRAPAKGRPGKVFRLASSSANVLGLLIGIHESVMAPAGLDGMPRLGSAVRFRTPTSYDALFDTIISHAQAFLGAENGKCLGIGLAIPGLVNETDGSVAFSPNLHFLDDRTLCADLQMRLGVTVVATQEEHALCLAEQHLGGATNLTDYAALDVSAGMGMGVVSSGRYVSGHRGFAGEIGHVTAEPNGLQCGCGNRGCLETVATDQALLAAVNARLGQALTFEQVLEGVSNGSLDVEHELDRTLDYLAIALAAVTNLFNPQAIFLYGRLFDLHADVLQRLIAKCGDRSLGPSFHDVHVVRAQGNKLYGALAGLLDRVFAAVGPRLA